MKKSHAAVEGVTPLFFHDNYSGHPCFPVTNTAAGHPH
jgi:hypothetical protein